MWPTLPSLEAQQQCLHRATPIPLNESRFCVRSCAGRRRFAASLLDETFQLFGHSGDRSRVRQCDIEVRKLERHAQCATVSDRAWFAGMNRPRLCIYIFNVHGKGVQSNEPQPCVQCGNAKHDRPTA